MASLAFGADRAPEAFASAMSAMAGQTFDPPAAPAPEVCGPPFRGDLPPPAETIMNPTMVSGTTVVITYFVADVCQRASPPAH
jgi:hypothetical protein